MAQVPAETVRLYLARSEEIPAARAWAARKGLEFWYDPEVLKVRLGMVGPAGADGGVLEAYAVTGELDDYPVLPPALRFVDPRTGGAVGRAGYPQPTGSSILHGNGLVCAPWNRLAYQVEGGVHGDWGAQVGWKTAAPGYTHAVTIPDMLDWIAYEVSISRGRMDRLPELR